MEAARSFSKLLIVTHVPVAVFTAGCLAASVGMWVLFEQEIDTLIALVGQGAHEVDALQLFAVKARAVWAVFLSLLLTSVLVGTMVTMWSHNRMVQGFETKLAERDAALRWDHERQVFRTRLTQAMSMADRESEALVIAERALDTAAPGLKAELLIANPGQSRLRRDAVGSSGAAGCRVQDSDSCHAVRRGSPLVFDDAGALDACPQLWDRDAGAAVCVPVSVMGRNVGVLHATGDLAPGAHAVAQLTFLADQLGTRIGMVRALATSQLQAETDALTGLLNRRSVEARVTPLLEGGSSAAVAMCDLDHFKRLNDTYGHACGDRALRLFAEVTQALMPEHAIIGRYGGEEFVIVLPDTHLDEAAVILDELRADLAEAVTEAGLPPFTVSIGLTHTARQGRHLETLLEGADALLYAAKEGGRDRVEIERRLAAVG